ncbi:helix-turn-helix transcriptional regulator [Nocardia uniformis]|uniref:Helix-turn-helix transcriptional regulator n=2 Tax=Nocardia uniformis TaxID=53432 RepID=A0A849C811_9NOCA|nr:helix-turn-helix transcriptional regulator [Nocardia uniformis]
MEAVAAEPDPIRDAAVVEFAPYGDRESDCPARLILDLFDNSWLMVIAYTLRDGPLRPVELRREIGGISQKMLTQTLRRMERMALIERHRYPAAPPRVEYSLTAAGQDLLIPILALGAWVDRHGDTVRSAMFGGDLND